MAEKKDAKSKFLQKLTRDHAGVKLERAKIVESGVKRAQTMKIMSIESELEANRVRLLELEDFGPSQTTDLTVASRGFSAESWVEEYHKTQVAIERLEIHLKLAKATEQAWFG